MGLTSSNPGTWLPIDVKGPRVTIEHAHSEIHNGNHFSTTHAVSVGTATAATVLIQTPASPELHMTFAVSCNNTSNWTFSEAPNASGGTAITTFNNYRSSTTTSGTTMTHTATWVSNGTVLMNGLTGIAGAPVRSNDAAGDAREWILLPSTLYLIRCVVLNANTTVNINTAFHLES